MSGEPAGAGRHRRDAAGVRQEENPFTVLLIDPLALPLAELLARAGRRRVAPNHVTVAGLVVGLLSGPLFLWQGLGPGAFGAGPAADGGMSHGGPLWLGGLAFYLALVADCVDGKLAHRTGRTSALGKRLESLADRLRVLSAWAGLLIVGWATSRPWLVLAMAAYVAVPAFRAVRSRVRPGADDPGRWLGDRLPVPPWLRRRRIAVWYGSWDRTAVCFALAPVLGPAAAGPVALVAVLVDAAMVLAGTLAMRRRAGGGALG